MAKRALSHRKLRSIRSIEAIDLVTRQEIGFDESARIKPKAEKELELYTIGPADAALELEGIAERDGPGAGDGVEDK